MKMFLAALIFFLLSPAQAFAGRFEISAGFNFNQNNYGGGDTEWTRRWGASLGYHFSDRSEFELSFQDVVDRTQIANYQDTTFHDQIYALNWVQSILGKDFLVDPFFKVGIGQLNRSATGSYYAFGTSPASEYDSVTGILGAGARVNITHLFGLRFEADTYLTGGNINTWRDNVSVTAGFSFFF